VILLVEEAMRSGDPLAGLIYNAIGSELVEAAADRIAADLRGRLHPGEALTLRYSPGYCGMSLSQQRTNFRLIEAGDIGVELLPTLIMKPIKSVSGLIGMGPQEAVEAFGNPCDRCPLLDCRMRR
jgi:cobalamin-dependent methionine synthase I